MNIGSIEKPQIKYEDNYDKKHLEELFSGAKDLNASLNEARLGSSMNKFGKNFGSVKKNMNSMGEYHMISNLDSLKHAEGISYDGIIK